MILLPLNDTAAPSPKRARRPIPVGGAERLGRILDEGDSVGSRQRDDRGRSRRTGRTGRRRRPPWAAGARCDPGRRARPASRSGRHSRSRRRVDEHRGGAEVAHGVDRRREGERGDEDLVVRADADLLEHEVECGGAGGESDPETASALRRDVVFEAVQLRADRRDPAAVDGFDEPGPVVPGDLRWREPDAGHGAVLSCSVGRRQVGSSITRWMASAHRAPASPSQRAGRRAAGGEERTSR